MRRREELTPQTESPNERQLVRRRRLDFDDDDDSDLLKQFEKLTVIEPFERMEPPGGFEEMRTIAKRQFFSIPYILVYDTTDYAVVESHGFENAVWKPLRAPKGARGAFGSTPASSGVPELDRLLPTETATGPTIHGYLIPFDDKQDLQIQIIFPTSDYEVDNIVYPINVPVYGVVYRMDFTEPTANLYNRGDYVNVCVICGKEATQRDRNTKKEFCSKEHANKFYQITRPQ
jgi:hypothetical protein